ncbi:methyl-accepting chemotaxis protein [Castellaniella sp.]|uniref:methyl-accepting chemotaxis protein n=1 Tax=Castellaniella sp. TaxID=1955812 RepID=UPI002AFF7B0C|nr:methyl-accepting chemotaxis protein [Castellaniella sp.]
MRKNHPVTQNENDYADTEILMSATDLKGKITYVNASFARVCKYLPTEMVGQPHNMIRHPDVPEAAYNDLWKELKQDRFWTGMLKNRCKDGDFYWVRANVAPIFQDGKKVGYISVRTKPSRAQVAEAQSLYDSYKDGRPKAHFRRSYLIRTGVRGLYDRLQGLGLRSRLWTTTAAACLGWGAMAWAMGLQDMLWAKAVLPVWLGAIIMNLYVDRRFVQRSQSVLALAAQAAIGQKLSTDNLLGGADEFTRIQQALIQANFNARSFVDDASHLITQLGYAVNEITGGSQALSDHSVTAAQRLEEIYQLINENTEVITKNGDSLNQVTLLAKQADASAANLGELAQNTAQQIQQMDEAGQRIGGIVSIIDSIAFQTNILALNAAVEAARAGESGRGFAVVAAEVRALAQRSAASAKEISAIIKEIIDLAGASTIQANRTVEASAEMRTQNTQIENLLAKISEAEAQQIHETNSILKSLEDLNQVTTSNASMSEEFATTVQSVDDQIQVLNQATQIRTKSLETRQIGRPGLEPRSTRLLA